MTAILAPSSCNSGGNSSRNVEIWNFNIQGEQEHLRKLADKLWQRP